MSLLKTVVPAPNGTTLRGVAETQVIAGRKAGGKSELHRAGCRVTPGEGNLEESATENKPRVLRGP